jgi:hypothetical protein
MARITTADLRRSVEPAEGAERRRTDRPARVRRPASQAAGASAASPFWTAVFALASVAAIALGWYLTVENHITPKEGAGYWLGVAGSAMMLALLLYPARKHAKFMQSIGTIPGWFKAHMILGVIGPVLVLMHSSFELNSKNASVAMISMILVVVSGIVGIFVYARLHFGLYGRKAEVGELIKIVAQKDETLSFESAVSTEMIGALRALADSTLATTRSLNGSLKFQLASAQRHKLKRNIHADIQATLLADALADRDDPETLQDRLDIAHAQIDSYFLLINQIGSLRLYERVFSVWHMLHLPLFIVLIVTALLHVFAVHWY